MKKRFPELQSGLEVMHNGRAVRLMYLTDTSVNAETWRVQPLFVEELPRDEVFVKGDSIKRLHVKVRGAA